MNNDSASINHPWEAPLEELWIKIRANPPDTPHYQKLSLLAQLKASEAQIKSADNTATYTKWIAAFTIVVAVGTAAQVVLGALSYFASLP